MSAKVFTHMKPPSCAIRLEESYGFFSCFISDEIRHPPWGMLRVFRPEAEECRKSSDFRQEKDSVLLLNASVLRLGAQCD